MLSLASTVHVCLASDYVTALFRSCDTPSITSESSITDDYSWQTKALHCVCVCVVGM